jgi:hypothetical protein
VTRCWICTEVQNERPLPILSASCPRMIPSFSCSIDQICFLFLLRFATLWKNLVLESPHFSQVARLLRRHLFSSSSRIAFRFSSLSLRVASSPEESATEEEWVIRSVISRSSCIKAWPSATCFCFNHLLVCTLRGRIISNKTRLWICSPRNRGSFQTECTNAEKSAESAQWWLYLKGKALSGRLESM